MMNRIASPIVIICSASASGMVISNSSSNAVEAHEKLLATKVVPYRI